jgi:opacity protein-like surface antigen
VYATGKYFVGNKDWKGYLKGSAGLNLLLKNDPVNKAGWYTGVGAGVDYHISQKLLINAEYDFIAWQNDFYGVRLFHSFNLGIGYKF